MPGKYPNKIKQLPLYDGRFDAYKLAAEGASVLFASYPPGTEIEAHTHDTDNYGVITRGELILIMDGEEQVFKTGDWYHVPAHKEHAARFDTETDEIEFWFEAKPVYGKQDASYIAAGEFEGLLKLVTDFYVVMDTEAFAKTIRDMHPVDLEESIDKLARFLSGWLGGPKLYQKKHGSISIPGVHKPFVIDLPEHDAWLKCMQMALVKQDYAEDFKEYLLEQLKFPAGKIVEVNRKNRS